MVGAPDGDDGEVRLGRREAEDRRRGRSPARAEGRRLQQRQSRRRQRDHRPCLVGCRHPQFRQVRGRLNSSMGLARRVRPRRVPMAHPRRIHLRAGRRRRFAAGLIRVRYLPRRAGGPGAAVARVGDGRAVAGVFGVAEVSPVPGPWPAQVQPVRLCPQPVDGTASALTALSRHSVFSVWVPVAQPPARARPGPDVDVAPFPCGDRLARCPVVTSARGAAVPRRDRLRLWARDATIPRPEPLRADDSPGGGSACSRNPAGASGNGDS